MKAFSPRDGATVNIDVGASSAAVKVCDDRGLGGVRVMNNGSATVWIAFGKSTVTASLETGVPVGPGAIEVLRSPEKTDGQPLYAAAIAAGATGKIYFTPGDGI